MKKKFDPKYFYYVRGEEQGIIESFFNLAKAKAFIKNMQRCDKEEGIEDTYYITKEFLEYGNKCFARRSERV